MGSEVHLAVDTMSGDLGLRVSVPASLQILQQQPHLHLHLIGEPHALEESLSAHAVRDASRIQIIPSTAVIAMDARPAAVLRRAAGSSIQVALDHLKAGEVTGLVSAGNTGVLMALARRSIGMLPGYTRPACCSPFPVKEGRCYMLDLGANVDCSAQHLHEFAAMGSVLASALDDIQSPRVALLSNGSEEGKGNDSIRLAYQRIKEDKQLNFVGAIEGSLLHNGIADVIVCDGLLGNVALKVAEGTASLAAELVRESFTRHWWSRITGLLAAPQLRDVSTSLSVDAHGGAFLLGLQGVVVKTHGGSSEKGFVAAIAQAAHCVQENMVPRLSQYLNVKETEHLTD